LYSTSRSGGGSGGDSGGRAAPGGGTTNNHFYIEGAISADTLTQVCAQISSGTKSGQFTLTSSNSLYNGEKLG
jgi:hypothetical protein